ncbi:Glyoxalase/Bleomycin resistance protein/Dioxygenase superfamily protein [Streptomyces misionensis]|uniref:Glyoxalase/Bleomycin resistance protein/Dioxygenase superfamily protein n=1 Tax=Streptomyces misionensis TaxID=67331 RepID=A0A1H5BG40_9ACTN|nr:VOC family protein [Streptomyces misionensis]SED53004.1 Glyoxalase/Bleomycin resistance protein/Dioxygenase superfamily protein [Streptomyces misionensis]
MLHHVELWVRDLERAGARWGWLLAALGWEPYQEWGAGRSWRAGETYVVIEESPALRPGAGHDRMRPGMNHLAFHAPDRGTVDALAEGAAAHGWAVLFPERHPHAGGAEHYAVYLEDVDGFEVEVVAQ